MICGVIEIENVVQVNDKTRLSAAKSFAAKDEAPISKVEIRPEGTNSADYIDVTGTSSDDWFLDWLYTGSSRVATVSLRITTDDPDNPEVFTKDIQIYTESDDALFSGDKDLMAIEPDILKWVPDGRASWLNVHRAAQEKILDWLNKAGIQDADKEPLTKTAITEIDEVRFWSRDLTLALIFKGAQNIKDDVFSEKAKFYFNEANKATDRARLRLDVDGDGTAEPSEYIGLTSADLVRA